MQGEGLDDFSRVFGKRLFSAFPEFESIAEVRLAKDGSRYLWVEPPPPTGAGPDMRLAIGTEGGEVFIGCHVWHGHFKWPRGPMDYDALAMIQALVDETLWVEAYFRTDGQAGATLVVDPAHAEDWAPFIVAPDYEDLETLPNPPFPTHRSWRGSRDRDF